MTFGGYVLDRITGKTRLVTRLNNGTPAEGSQVRISADGSIVTFDSEDATLTHGDGIRYEVFARNLNTGKTQMLSRTRKRKPGNGDSYYSSLSENGRFASFDGYAVNLGGNPSFTQGFRAGPIH